MPSLSPVPPTIDNELFASASVALERHLIMLEKQALFLSKFRERFEKNFFRIEDCEFLNWDAVELSLKLNPEYLEALVALEARGGEPTIIKVVEGGVVIADLAKHPRVAKSYNEALHEIVDLSPVLEIWSYQDYLFVGRELEISLDTSGVPVYLNRDITIDAIYAKQLRIRALFFEVLGDQALIKQDGNYYRSVDVSIEYYPVPNCAFRTKMVLPV